MYQKNDVLTVDITDQGSAGEGIGKADGYTVFVKDTVAGDRVRAKIMKAKKNYAFGKLLDIIDPSPHRVEPACPVAKACGGCQLAMMDYPAQLKFKQDKVYNDIKRIGGIKDFVMRPIIGMDEPLHYRNKSQYPVGRDRSGNIISGFFAGRTHTIIPVDRCMLCERLSDGTDVSAMVTAAVKQFMVDFDIEPYDEKTCQGLVRHILIRVAKATGQVMVCLVVNGNSIPQSDELVRRLKKIPGVTDISLNINRANTNVIMGSRTEGLYGPGYIEDRIKELHFRISPLSFFQVNSKQTTNLYDKILEYANLTGGEIVWDLYCGIGSISLFLAANAAKVTGVEIVHDAVVNARENAKINGLDNVMFLEGAAEEVVPKYFEEHIGAPETRPDVIVVDPPRKGCDEKLLCTIVRMKPDRLVYVSCDSSTLARDIKWLSGEGMRLEEVTCCDMFGMSVHVESVAILRRIHKEQIK